MFLNDIAEVIYAPRKAFKRIIANPKYLGIIIIILLFLGLSIGYEYSQFSKVHIETTSPVAGAMQDYNNATSWLAGSNVVLTNNFDDYFNNTVYLADYASYYALFGNNSLQIQANNTNGILIALTNTSNVDCTANGFQNLSLTLKLISPQSAPSNATLILYSLSDNNYYTYDLTSQLQSASAVNQWGNLTIPLGPEANGWTESGNPTWQNITALTLQLNYPTSDNITLRIGALFFRGEYIQPLTENAAGFLYTFILEFTLQFLASWLVLTGMIYLVLKAFKTTVTWKPIFVAVGLSLIVMAIRAVITLAATATLPDLYYPYDTALGVVYDAFGSLYYPAQMTLPIAESAAAITNITAAMAVFKTILTVVFVASYVWLAGLTTLIVKELKPEFTTLKCIMVAAIGVAVTILVLWLFIGFV
ncbi:MAG TPA: hypothetical protein VLH35_07335 [Candidatus Acidoferrales bacterium]|nr:hypothetical protein [Candidatus Acidoferrales bacterium]